MSQRATNVSAADEGNLVPRQCILLDSLEDRAIRPIRPRFLLRFQEPGKQRRGTP
jgi:hypothetical protein